MLQLIVRCAVLIFFIPALLGQTIAVTDCTLIDTRYGMATAHSSIVITGDRITARGPAASTPIPTGGRIVRGSGKFVIPGLWDMHVHVGEIEEDWFPLYLVNGLTGLREMAASEKNAPRQRQYQQDVARERRLGPELFWTLFPMDAPAINDERQARAEVARRAAMGLSYIKIYNGLSRESYFAIADECRTRGLQMVGHIPDQVSAREVARAGQASVEHLDGVLLACSRKEAEARWMVQHNQNAWKMLLDTFDSAKADALIETFRAGGVWQTPTLVMYRIASLAEDHRLPGDAPIQYARRDYLKGWPREALGGPFGGLDAGSARRLFALYQDLLRRMERRGVRILAGTDTPYPYCVPGFALHEELALLVEAGLSPAAALRTATWNPAEFLHVSQDYGSLEPSKVADLVVLDANPLIAIANTRRIHAVVRRGHLIEAAELHAMLEGVRTEVGKNGTTGR
ncbi:MAG: amidohydrolase family protein [Candidatus Sulfopaludibacter sp.]|nr:amidohydrolase family protein [Candidatus Sulfopaludibacter sp.]